MPLNSDVQEQINKAKSFRAATSPSADWKVIICFYTALHWVKATYKHETGRTLPNSHSVTEERLDAFQKLSPKLKGKYVVLRGLSERARYQFDQTATITADDVKRAENYRDLLQAWAEEKLKAAGYTV